MRRILLALMVLMGLVMVGLILLIALRTDVLLPRQGPLVGPPTPSNGSRSSPHAAAPAARGASAPAPVPSESASAERARLDQAVWANEVLAQEYELPFVKLWDAMRARVDDQHVLLAAFPFAELSLKPFGAPETHRWVTIARMAGEARKLDQEAWRALVARLADDGYRIEYIEFHHAAFDPATAAAPARSKVSTKIFIRQAARGERHVLSGVLDVVWAPGLDAAGLHQVASIDATNLTLTSRVGEDAFVEAFHSVPEEHTGAFRSALEPTFVYDLDGDGRDDVVMPRWNKVYLNRSTPGKIAFELKPLLDHPLIESPNGVLISAGVLADVTGDGNVDLVLTGINLPPTLFVGGPGGTFADPPRTLVDLPPKDFRLPMGMTAGDVDGDGKVDLWIGQYQRPFDTDSLPNPYWDANDGPPSFLLLNNGDGTFRDATEAMGLSAKRHRRNYSASFVDLDEDGRLDLVTVNDFSGVDVFLNTGKGFRDATDELVDLRHSYGMSHAFADFDGDGRLDLFVAGMGSTTARRLEYMKLGRADFPEHQKMRMPMGYGNRLYLGGADHHFRQAPFNDQVARTGWSWGCTAFDVDNGGDVDLFVNNGFMSRKTAKDYCSRWWTHDIYQACEPRRPDLLEAIVGELNDQGTSWNGFEHKSLLMNEGGKSFVEVAYAMNLAYEWDAREAVSADFDGDGLVDLMSVNSQYNSSNYLPIDPVLRVFRNRMPRTNHWLGVRVRDESGHSPLGATITVFAGGRKHVGVIVAGDSFRSQHPLCKHFGLGAVDAVDSVDVRWIDGAKKVVEHPAVDAELLVRP